MGKNIKFDYYYGKEEDQFSFYRIPKLLFTDEHFKCLSNDAKLLYGLMLDRMSLSMKNGWKDKEDRTYIIYTVEQIAADLACGRDKAIKVSAELDSKKGIGLIEKVKRGLGKPDKIYVKNFVIQDRLTDRGSISSEVDYSDFKESGNYTSVSREIGTAQIDKSYPNNTNINKTDNSNTNLINLSDAKDEMSYSEYKEFVKDIIDYDILKQDSSKSDTQLVDAIVELMTEVAISDGDYITISGKKVPKSVVVSRFEKYDMMTVQYVMECMKENTSDVKNIKQYLLAVMYNAPVTIGVYYQQKVNYDLYG